MKSFTEFLKRHSLVAGILLMFLLTWPFDLALAGLLPFKVPYFISITFGWGVSLAALIMTALTAGKDGVVTLLKRFLIWRVGWKWYFLAFFLYPIVFSSAVLLSAARTGTPIDFSGVFAHKVFGASANLPLFILPFFIFDFLTNGEEMGWRGYVLPRLQTKHGFLLSSLLLGVVWAFWHFPRYLAPGNAGSFPLLLVKILADAVIYTKEACCSQRSCMQQATLLVFFLPMANTQSAEHLDSYILAIVFLIGIASAITLHIGAKEHPQIEAV